MGAALRGGDLPALVAVLGNPLAMQVVLVAAAASDSLLAVEEPLCHDPLALVGLGDGDRAVVATASGDPLAMQEELGDDGGDDVHAVEVVVASGNPPELGSDGDHDGVLAQAVGDPPSAVASAEETWAKYRLLLEAEPTAQLGAGAGAVHGQNRFQPPGARGRPGR